MISFMKEIEIMNFGVMREGVLEVSNNFQFSKTVEETTSCIVVTMISQYIGELLPQIRFELTVSGQSKPFYISHDYSVGKYDEYTRQEWRVPPMFLPGMTLKVCVDVPDGTTLYIRDFRANESMYIKDWNFGLRHNAHLGFWGIAPDNTMPAFELAATCGFPACIVVPKVTADGVIVCIHDDTINRTARDENGDAPEEKLYVSDLTYDELLKWDYGSYKNEIYKGTKIPLLEDFFILCAKTGMRPMFSTHPALTIEQWKQVKDMLIRYGLLQHFHIKSFKVEILQTAYSVFGTDIEGYTWDHDDWTDWKLEEMLNSGIDISKCRVGMEVRFKDYTEQIAKKITDAGLFAAVWELRRTTSEEYRRLISYGVTEFTEDYHCSMGLNW